MTEKIIAFLLETTVAFSLLFAGVWIIKKAFGKRLSAFMHYALWGVVILKLALPFSIASEFSPWMLFSQANTAAQQGGGYSAEERNSGQFYDDYVPERVAGYADETEKAGVKAPGNQRIADAQPNVFPPVKTDWAGIAAAVWLSGTAAMAAWLMFSSWSIRRRIAKNSTDSLPGNVAQAFVRCTKTLRIKTNIRPVLQNVMGVPAITGAVRPILILPEGIERLSAHELEHIIMHELMHYKRGDLAVTLALNVINAFYWFNPVVWLALRLIRKDMETVCDNAVLKALGQSRRQTYIGTVLRFAGRRNKNRLIAALSLSDAKTTMQARIKGMFMAGRTRLKVRFTVFALVLAMLAPLLRPDASRRRSML